MMASTNEKHDVHGGRTAALAARHRTAAEHAVHRARKPKARPDCATRERPACGEWREEDEYQQGENTRKHSMKTTAPTAAPHWRAWARKVHTNKITFPYAYGTLKEEVAWKEVQKKAVVTEQKRFQ